MTPSDADALTPEERAALAAHADAPSPETDFEPVFAALFPAPIGDAAEKEIVDALTAAARLAEEAASARQASALAVVVRRDGAGGVSVQIGLEVSGANVSFVVFDAPAQAASSTSPESASAAPSDED